MVPPALIVFGSLHQLAAQLFGTLHLKLSCRKPPSVHLTMPTAPLDVKQSNWPVYLTNLQDHLDELMKYCTQLHAEWDYLLEDVDRHTNGLISSWNPKHGATSDTIAKLFRTYGPEGTVSRIENLWRIAGALNIDARNVYTYLTEIMTANRSATGKKGLYPKIGTV